MVGRGSSRIGRCGTRPDLKAGNGAAKGIVADVPGDEGGVRGVARTPETVCPCYLASSIIPLIFDGVLATSKSGTLLLRRDQGDVAVLLDSRRCRL